MMERTRVIRVTALDIEGALRKYQAAIGNDQNINQMCLSCSVIGIKSATRSLNRIYYTMSDQVLHDFSQKMVRDVQALGKL